MSAVERKPLELTVEITNFCKEGCTFCSSDATPEGKHLPFEEIKNFIEKYSNIDVINISGGEPISHPEFYKILEYCKTRARFVWVYSNAIEHLAYNTHVIKEVNIRANVCLTPSTEVYIPKGSFQVNLLKFVSQGRGKNIEEVKVHCSGNLLHKCETCNNPTLKSDGSIALSPCKK